MTSGLLFQPPSHSLALASDRRPSLWPFPAPSRTRRQTHKPHFPWTHKSLLRCMHLRLGSSKVESGAFSPSENASSPARFTTARPAQPNRSGSHRIISSGRPSTITTHTTHRPDRKKSCFASTPAPRSSSPTPRSSIGPVDSTFSRISNKPSFSHLVPSPFSPRAVPALEAHPPPLFWCSVAPLCCANYLRFPFTLPLIRSYDPGAHVLAVRLEITYKDTPFPFAIPPSLFSLLQPSPQVKTERMYPPSIVLYFLLDCWLVCDTHRSAGSTSHAVHWRSL